MAGQDVSDDAEGSGGWRKSSRSYGAGDCIEVAPSRKRIDVRDSKNAHGAAVLTFGAAQWNAFLVSVRNGVFDL